MGRPSLELDWELGIFKALRSLWRAVTPTQAPAFDADRAAQLATVEGRLRIVGSVLAGRPVRILTARTHGGIRGRDLLLPPWIDLLDDPEANAGLYLLRVATGATICRLSPKVPADPDARFLAGLRVGREAIALLREELPGYATALDEVLPILLAAHPAAEHPAQRLVHAALRGEPLDEVVEGAASCPPPLLWGALIPVEVSEASDADADAAPPSSGGTEEEAPPVEDLTIVHRDPDRVTELPTHTFEKVETLEEFAGTLRQLDGGDDLSEHMEALSELDLSHLIRGGPQAHSVYRADISMGASVPDISRIEPGETALRYDEWDFRRRRYRPGWCSVYPAGLPPGDPSWSRAALRTHRRLIETLHRRLLARRSRLRPAHRQRSGEDVDVDAVVDARAALAAGRQPSRRLYIRQRRAQRDIATTVLLDLSLSSDAWINNRRVLDVAREAVLVLGEVADRLGDRLQVLGFASQTRNQVRVWCIRDWHEPWSVGRGRLGGLAPQGYTRIGPAIRHAAAGLARVSAKDRLLLLVSDGKPTDYDRYEGRYGVADVRQAIREARQQRIHTHALAIDVRARDYLPQMLGTGGWSILPRPDDLVETLSAVYSSLS
ncbi:MAG: nitric oxide reductase NorD protein [Myxococcota bacterium]